MARKFLYVIAALIVLVIAALFALRIWGVELARLAFVPSKDVVALTPLTPADYDKPDMWFSHPRLRTSTVKFYPLGYKPRTLTKGAAIFYIHPTTYLNRSEWNAPLDDKDAKERAIQINRMQASVFSNAGEVWSPRYRQATFGSFLAPSANATKAQDYAYKDVEAAFSAFLKANPAGPILLAGHSQGSLHLLRLLNERVKGTPLQTRLVAAYVVGWPVSVANDLPALGIPACDSPDSTGCILSWQSWAEPADYAINLAAFEGSKGLNGQPNKGTQMLCSNPLTGGVGGAAKAAANLGTLKYAADKSEGKLLKGLVLARCDDHGMLLIGDAPDLGNYTMPGNNYHVYDYSLFWANISADAERRVARFQATK